MSAYSSSSVSSISVLALALPLAVGCGAPEPPVGRRAASLVTIPAPPNTGRYCSMTWPDGGWAFAWYTNQTDDPCAYIRAHSDPGGTIRRAGQFSTTGVNNIVARCGPGQGWVKLGVGTGTGPLSWAYNEALGQGRCVFTVSPRELPIFERVYPAGTATEPATGVDFARGPYDTLDLAGEFGQPGASSAARKVDWLAQDRSSTGYVDDHDGWDFNMAKGTDLLAPADGVVLAARFRDVSNACPGESDQGEVYLQHVVSAGSPTRYTETFVTYFAHLDKIHVEAGHTVTKGTVIGTSGDTGCSSAPHLHLGTFRLSNTADALLHPLVINTNFSAGMDQNSANGYEMMIDPYGFYPPAGFDPWAWRAYPWGALSVNLWKEGHAPATGGW